MKYIYWQSLDASDSIFVANQSSGLRPWRRGAVDIASASGTRRPGFESRQGIRFLGKHSSNMHCLCVEKRDKDIDHENIFF
jgi:hypothetical protein